jgi:hypothetical protein
LYFLAAFGTGVDGDLGGFAVCGHV